MITIEKAYHESTDVFELLENCKLSIENIDREIDFEVISDIKKGSATEKGDWKPLLFLFTDGILPLSYRTCSVWQLSLKIHKTSTLFTRKSRLKQTVASSAYLCA